jgi:hypothetical protein
LVPSIDGEQDAQAEEAQKKFTDSLLEQDRRKYFSPNSNPAFIKRLSVINHFMSQYQPYLHNQLLESIDPQLTPARRLQRQKFKQQMTAHGASIPKGELKRNKIFLDMHEKLAGTLRTLEKEDGVQEAMLRFSSVTDVLSYCEKNYC